MKIIVTGAMGFVGINLLRDLSQAGHEVLGVDIVPPDELATRFLEPAPPVRITIADLMSDGLTDALENETADVAIHAAAVTPLATFEEEQSVLAASVNVAGTARLMRWVRQAGVPRVVHVSTGSVYGPVEGDSPVGEDTSHQPDGVYGITKSAGDQLARRLAFLGGISLSVVRLSHVYGPMERPSAARSIPSPVERWTRAMDRGEPISPARDEILRDFIHIGDVTTAIEMLTIGEAEGVFNISSGQQTSETELVDHLREIDPSLRIGKARKASVAGTPRPPLAIDRIRAIGWIPSIGLREGLRSYVAWRRATGG